MDKRMLALLMLLCSVSPLAFAADDSNPFCPLNPTPSYLDIILEPPKGPGSIITTYIYNISREDYIKNGLPHALIIVVNQTNKSATSLCYEYADSEGWANFTYDSNLDGCTDYWFIFCPHSDAIGGTPLQTAARQTCLNGTGLPASLIRDHPIYDLEKCNKGGNYGPDPLALKNYLPSHNQFYMCSTRPKSYGGLCWPLMLIFAILVGANFLMGKNPFLAFDLSAMRMNRGRQYTMRQQQKSMDVTSVVMAVDKATQMGSGGKFSAIGALTGVVKSAVGGKGGDADQKVTVNEKGEIVDSKGNAIGLKMAEGKVVDALGKDTGATLKTDPKGGGTATVVKDGVAQNRKQLSELATAQALGQRGMMATATSPDILNALGAFKELYNVVAGKKSETGAMERDHAALFGTDEEKIKPKNRREAAILTREGTGTNKTVEVSGGTMWSRLYHIVANKFTGMNRTKDEKGNLDWGNMLKSALSMYMIYKTVAEYQRAARSALGGGSKVAEERIAGVDDELGIKLPGGRQIGTIFGRNMSIGEVADWVANPNGMPYLLAPLAPLVDIGRDAINLQLTGTPPPGVMAAAKEFEVENKKYAVIKDTDGKYVVFGSDGKRANRRESAAVVKAIEAAGGYEKNKTMAYLRVGTDGLATKMDRENYENLCLRLEEWNDAKNKMRMHAVEGLAARLNDDEKGALGRVAEELGPGTTVERISEGIDDLLKKMKKGEKLNDAETALTARIVRTDAEGLGRMDQGDIVKMLEFTKKAADGGGLQTLFQIQALNLAMQMTERQNGVLRENRDLVSEKGKLDNETFAQIQGNDVLYRYYVNKEAEQSQLQDLFRGGMAGGPLFMLNQYQEKGARDKRIAELEKDIEQSKKAIDERNTAAKRSDTPAASKLAFEKENNDENAKVDGMRQERDLLKLIGDALGGKTPNVARASGALMAYGMALHRQNALETGLISEAWDTGLVKREDRDILEKLIVASTTGASSQFMDVAGKTGLDKAVENLTARQNVFNGLRDRIDEFRGEHGMNHLAALSNAEGNEREAIRHWEKDTQFLFRSASQALSGDERKEGRVLVGKWMDFKIASNYIEAGKSEKDIPAIGNTPESRYLNLIVSAQARLDALSGTIDEKDKNRAYKGSALKPADVKEKIASAQKSIGTLLLEAKEHANDQNRLEQLAGLATAADSYVGRAAGDEKRMSEYSEEGVRKSREQAELDVWHSTPYLQYPAGSALNQARGGGYFNVENDLISFFDKVVFGTVSPGLLASAISAVTLPGLPSSVISAVTPGNVSISGLAPYSTEKYDKEKVFQGALLGSSVWAPVAGPSVFGFSFDPWVPKEEEKPKPAPILVYDKFPSLLSNTSMKTFGVSTLYNLDEWDPKRSHTRKIEGEYGDYSVTWAPAGSNKFQPPETEHAKKLDEFLYNKDFQMMKFDGAFRLFHQVTGTGVDNELIGKTLSWDENSKNVQIVHNAEGGLNDSQITLLKVLYRTHTTRDYLNANQFAEREAVTVQDIFRGQFGIKLDETTAKSIQNEADPAKRSDMMVSVLRNAAEASSEALTLGQNITFYDNTLGKSIKMSFKDRKWTQENIFKVIREEDAGYKQLREPELKPLPMETPEQVGKLIRDQQK